MKKLLLVTLLSILSVVVFSQSEEGFTRKGKYLVETGSSFFSGSGASTGGSILFDDGSTLTQIGIEAGKFVSENLAFKIKLGTFGGSGTTFTNIAAGAKYYIAGVAPIDLNAGILTGFGSTSFIGSGHIGYAIKAANNIYFEPKVGVIVGEDSTVGSLQFSFALIL